MIRLTQIIDETEIFDDEVTLPRQAREKSRLLARSSGGRDLGFFLPRGTLLRGGQVLTGPGGERVLVRAALESVSVARGVAPLAFAKACYHLGNRHVPVQILADELRYLADPVLDDMLRRMGLTLSREELPFEPEPGAYHGHGHA